MARNSRARRGKVKDKGVRGGGIRNIVSRKVSYKKGGGGM